MARPTDSEQAGMMEPPPNPDENRRPVDPRHADEASNSAVDAQKADQDSVPAAETRPLPAATRRNSPPGRNEQNGPAQFDDATRPSAAASSEYGVMLGQYRILEQIGSGGMGRVFKALHTRLDRFVALKLLPPGMIASEQLIARFHREIRAIGKLQHPHIVAALDAGEFEGTHFLTMELIEGCDLASLVTRLGPLSIADACEIVRQAAVGLQQIARSQMVHRDLKPSNLMLARSSDPDESPIVKILDLGLARFDLKNGTTKGELTSTGQVIGTVDYMAPEQGFETEYAVDVRADIYSLGATLFKLLTGRAPFDDAKHNSTLKRMMALARESPPALDDLRPDCPAELAALVARMLAKSPVDRPAEPKEVIQVLTPFAKGANLARLLEQASISSEIPSVQSLSKADFPPASTRVHNTDGTTVVTATLANHSSSANRNSRYRRWGILGGLCAAALMFAAVVIQTEQGSVQIEVPDDLVSQLKLSVLRDGAPDGSEFVIKPGSSSQEHWIRSGRIEVRLAADQADEFDLQPQGELVIRRGKTAKVKLIHRSTEPKSDAAAAVVGKISGSPEQRQAVPRRLTIDEPPPLEEWLNSRTVLTVAQDGSGQFQTIQAAFDALKPGQVIQVMDQGPYRELLRLQGLPPDTGLISKCQTTLEAESYEDKKGNNAVHAHMLGPSDGFRLSGFRLSAPMNDEWGSILAFRHPVGIVIEDCNFGFPQGPSKQTGVSFGNGILDSRQNVVRNCLFRHSGVHFRGNANLLVMHNLFQDSLIAGDCPSIVSLMIRNNVLSDFPRSPIWISGLERIEHMCDISQNTAYGNHTHSLLSFVGKAPFSGVVCRLNLADGLIDLDQESISFLGKELPGWELSHNGYMRLGQFRKSADDVLTAPEYISADPSHRNYLRLTTQSPLAKCKMGETVGMGALSPGPAPKEGDWFTKLRERWGELKPEMPAEAKEMTGPIPIDEPPPLEEWLNGRTILTVAQDGSGQFKSIQAALDAVQPGQAVQVLDKGPYRERLEVAALPQDTGLFSSAETVLESPAWKYLYDFHYENVGTISAYAGHILLHAKGFRIHGFEFRFPPHQHKVAHRFSIANERDFTLENCCIRSQSNFDGDHVDITSSGDGLSPGTRVTVRDCMIEGSLAISSPTSAATALVERNDFTSKKNQHYLMFAGSKWDKVRLHHNIFSSAIDTRDDIVFAKLNSIGALEITNNSFGSYDTLVFAKTLPDGSVTIRNNLHFKPGALMTTSDGAEQRQSLIAEHWYVDHNASQELSETKNSSFVVPLQRGNFATIPRLLSKIPHSPDYLRIENDDPLARAGAGGDWPNYIGALPPGPAPVGGDWFTKLRERWVEIMPDKPAEPKEKISGPLEIQEPPPLEEWLKGRTILTVAQDGSGQFKTVQAALDAVQTGQVVKVLDRGPYHERLELQSPPADIGLISEAQTRIEFTEFKPSSSDVQGWGHFFSRADRLRIHGFEFQIPQVPANYVTIGIHVSEPRGVVFENCAVRRKSSPVSQSLTFGDIKGSIDRPSVIRECFVEQGLQIYALHPLNSLPPTGSALVTRNYITGELDGLMAGGTFQHCVIRNNIFARTLQNPLIQQVVQADWFELSNNTFFTLSAAVRMDSLAAQFLHERSISGRKGEKNPPPAPIRGHAPAGQGAIYNNLHNRPGFMNVTGGAEDEPWTWQVGFNCYPGDGDIPSKNAMSRNTNIIANPIFYSILPHDRDYARLKPDSPGSTSKAGRKWPNTTGALPSGRAPQEGDWFTKLLGRWGDLKPSNP